MSKNLFLRTIAAASAAAFMLTSMPSVFAAEQALHTETVVVSQTGGPDNDELFARYVNSLFYGGAEIAPAAVELGRAGLSGLSLTIYDTVKTHVLAIAAGTESSADFSTNINTPAGEQTSDLVYEAFLKAMDALREDCPSELYWYNKTEGTTLRVIGPQGSSTVTSITGFTMSISNGYGSGTTVDSSKITAANKAIANAKQIAQSVSGKSDYEKLKAFNDRICELVSYNSGAVADDNTPYGDPWQLIYVFDNDTSTNVVCEGYAKAFQYLCELSEIECYTISGTMAGGTGAGAHMWNIVKLDGNYYHVDVTNCDSGSIGYPDKLFLKGVAKSSNGFSIIEMTYTYNSDVGNYIPSSVINNLSEKDYAVHNHTVSKEWSSDNDGHWHACSDCDEKLDYAEHSWKEVTVPATCTEAGKVTKTCTECGESTETSIAALGHKEEIIPAKAATCTEPGLTEGKKCSVCKTVIVEQEAINPLGHKEEIIPAKAATCTEPGLTEGKKCSVCKTVIVEQSSTDALGHNWSEWTTTKEPTETAEGEKSRTCGNCHKTETEIIAKLDHTHSTTDAWEANEEGHWHKCSGCTEKVGYEEHSWDGGTETKPATETEEGVKTYICGICSREKTESIPKLPHTHNTSDEWTSDSVGHWHICSGCTEKVNYEVHSWDEGTVTAPAACTENGILTKTCTVCNAEKEEAIKALGHKWDDGEITQKPTCTENGILTKTCNLCGNKTEETIDALAHKWDDGEITQKPTCTENGIRTKTCTLCGDTTEEAIDALGHDWSEWETVKEPTETEEGVKTRTCSVCNETETETITKLNHTHKPYSKWLSDTAGHWHACSGCDEKLDYAVHSWDNGETVKPATETEEGEAVYTCTVCGTVEIRKIPTLQHTHKPSGDWVYNTEGHWHACSECSEKADYSLHTSNGGIVTVQPTSYSVGTRTYSCTVCGAVLRTETIPVLDTPSVPSYVPPYTGSTTPAASNAPFIADSSSLSGWESITSEISASADKSDGNKVKVEMNGEDKLPESVLKALKNEDVTIEVKMNNKVSWKINGLSVTDPQTVDLRVSTVSRKIPESVIDSLGSEMEPIQLRLYHNGNFGFMATLSLKLNSNYNGKYAILYYYDLETKQPEMVGQCLVSDGKAEFEMTHASYYAVAFSSVPLYEDVSSAAAASADSAPIDSTVPVTNGVGMPVAELPKTAKFSGRKRRYRILEKI